MYVELRTFIKQLQMPGLTVQLVACLTQARGPRFDILSGHMLSFLLLLIQGGWSGGAMVLGKLPVPGRPTIWIAVGQGPIALAVGAGGGGLDIFTLIYLFSSFSLSLGDGPI